jgi:putative ABC transport system permease protein
VKEQVIPGQPKAGPLAEWQIVGVFHNVKSRSSREDNPEIDTSFWQEAYPIAGIGIRTANEPARMIQTVQAAVNAVDPQAGFALTRTMDQVHGAALSNDRFSVILLGSFGGVRLLLAGVGLYGVMAFSVTERRREMAIRVAQGAAPHRVLTLVVREGAVLACVGSAVGLLAALLVARAMQHVLFGIRAMDYATLGTVSAVTIAVAILACYLSARRAASANPVIALRSE